MAIFINQSFIFSIIILLFLLFIISSPSLSKPFFTRPSVYEVLKDYNFPVGLLPKGVLDYDLDPSNGKFSAYLNGTCGFSLEGSYQLKYKPNIRGLISEGRLSSLEGVSVKWFFIWVDIVEVLRSGDHLQFSVGIGGANFPIDNFVESPQCGCGLDCIDGQVSKVRKTNPFVSSYWENLECRECFVFELWIVVLAWFCIHIQVIRVYLSKKKSHMS